MRTISLVGVCALLFIAAACGGDGDTATDEAAPTVTFAPSNAGYSRNVIDAFDPYEDEIREEVYSDAYEEGYREGQREGEQVGYDEGYTIGYDEGFDEGFFDGCVWLGETLVANGAQIWYQC